MHQGIDAGLKKTVFFGTNLLKHSLSISEYFSAWAGTGKLKTDFSKLCSFINLLSPSKSAFL